MSLQLNQKYITEDNGFEVNLIPDHNALRLFYSTFHKLSKQIEVYLYYMT